MKADEVTYSLDVNTVVLVVLLDEVINNPLIKIFTTEMSVTSGSQDLENALVDGEDGDIESSSTKIVDQDVALVLVSLVQSISLRVLARSQHHG